MKITRRRFLTGSCQTAILAGLSPPSFPRVSAISAFDLVLRGAMVLDGTGGPPFRADLGIVGDTIAAIGTIDPEQARFCKDIAGTCLAPGFIDIHSHSDSSIFRYPQAESRVMQGITTEITGNCGSSAAPARIASDPDFVTKDRDSEFDVNRESVASYFEGLEQAGISVNLAMLVGQGTLRRNLIGLVDRSLEPSELTSILLSLEQALDEGVLGLSTGLEYTPGRYTPTREIVAMAQRVSRRGGLYASHVRNEEAQLLEAIDEAIQIGRKTGVRVQISHLKAAGRPNWEKQEGALNLIESGHRSGISVLADAYPYTAYATGLSIFVEPWALEGGGEALVERLQDSTVRQRIRRGVQQRVERDPGGYELITISGLNGKANQKFVGQTLIGIAEVWKAEPVDALLRLLEEESGSVSFIGHGMSDENVARVIGHPLVLIGSDGASMAPTGKALRTRPHPRSYGTCARILERYVREQKVLQLREAVKKMTSMPADQAGLRDRGRVAQGKKADLVVFDLEKVHENSTFQDPHRYPVGIHHVLVNGQFVVENGRHTGRRCGRVLRSA